MKIRLWIMAAMMWLASARTPAQQAPTCPLSPVDLPRLSGLAGKSALIGGKPAILTFQSKLDRDDDGAPNAYHRGLRDAGTDPGLDHICVGGSVLEFADGRLHDKYGAGGSVGQLAGIDPATGKGRSLLCKLDYLAIRDQGFPACGPGRLCMIWYGIAAEERACGFPSPFGGPAARGCGAPIRQLDTSGTPTDFYLTTTALRRPGAMPNTRTQSDYVDAAKVPYIVLPGGLHLPQGKAGSVGDLALMVWHGRTVFTVVGDVGPSGKIGEASRAAIAELRGGRVDAVPDNDPVTTIVFPETKDRMKGWPLSPADIEAQGRRLLEEAGGFQALRACAGLADLQ